MRILEHKQRRRGLSQAWRAALMMMILALCAVGQRSPIAHAQTATVAFTAPTDDAVVRELGPFSGTASATANGGPLRRVRFALFRDSDDSWWNGTAWQPTIFEFDTLLNGTNWSIASGLPTGASVTDGIYVAIAFADYLDSAGTRVQGEITLTADTTLPGAPTFAQPTDGATVIDLTTIAGQANDNSGGSGISAVDVSIRRTSDGLFWNGSAFVPGPVFLPAQAGGGFFNLQTTLRAPTLTDGPYTLTARASDGAGNQSSSSISVTVINDPIAPQVTWISPTDGQTLQTLTALRGTTTDNGGSGVVRVQNALLRLSDNFWWNGNAWTAAFTFLSNAQLNGGNWVKTDQLPSGADLNNGQYVAIAYSFDRIGNRGEEDVAFTINDVPPPPADAIAPTITIAEPRAGQFVQAIPAIRGLTTDNIGVSRVTVALFRDSDNRWWNGSAWLPTITELPATRNGTVYTSNFTPPTGVNLTDGLYVAVAFADDAAGNRGRAERSFTVDNTNPAQLTFERPTANQLVNNLLVLSGRVADNVGGSGIDGVDVIIRRSSDGLYWNGTAFVAGERRLPAQFGGGFWTLNTTLRPQTGLTNGGYVITAVARDEANNQLSARTTVRVLADTSAPVVGWTSPRGGANLRAFPVLTGFAREAAGGSGLRNVSISLLRLSDNRWWNGRAWQVAFVTLPATVRGQNFTFASPLPSGANLVSTGYVAVAYAFDQIGNEGREDVAFAIDANRPVAPIFSRPTANEIVTSLAPITGVARDAAGPGTGGSGLVRVDIQIQRASDGLIWNGSAFTRTPTLLPAAITGNNFRRDGAPAGSDLRPGLYRISATATDRAGNQNLTSIYVRVRDGQAPTIAIFAPTNNTFSNVIGPITGNATDVNGELTRVAVTIRRNSDGLFWNGSTYVETAVLLNATVAANGNWTVSNVPTGANLTTSTYTIAAYAFDAGANRSTTSVTISINTDATAPTISITNPTQGVTVRQLERVSGTVSDNIGGSGVQRVIVAILRQENQQWWNGRAFTDTFTPLPATVSGNTWTITSNLPPLGAAPTGAYSVIAQAFDRLGNQGQAEVAIGIDANGPVQAQSALQVLAASNVRLSSASVSGDTIRLSFTGALNASSATDAANYSVNDNEIEAVAFDRASNRVTLSLSAPVAGAVSVAWNLVDAGGKSIKGSATK